MTEKEYRSHPAISRSELWKMHESPEKFKWYKDNPMEPTPALLFGQVVHKMLLEPDDFFQEFVVAPDIDRRTKAGKEEWALFEDGVASMGVTVIKRDVYEQAKEMALTAMSNELVKTLLTGQHEVPYFWTDEDTGEDCKCRVDAITEIDGNLKIVDYKTASSAETNAFMKDVYKYGYHFQAAMYTEGVMRALGLTKRPEFTFIVQEKKPPYSVNVINVTEDVMLYGLDTFRELIGTYHSCKETGYWYGYLGPFGEANETYLPGWYTLGENDEEVENDS